MTDTVRLDRSFTRDPHTVLHQLRSQAPVSRAVMWGDVPLWLVTCYDDAKSVLTDPRLSTDHAVALNVLPPNNNGRYASLRRIRPTRRAFIVMDLSWEIDRRGTGDGGS